ncbi:hypothetical protein [Spiroplasma platyhelix]|uniref:Uncharacterized protein n=1 Tax=Spiroplasma platyhelix PALS-1 TaxID=1276218 RepID=A0A846U8N8_9MOLU|nr:hypothetical protein [Spiroplasma platyhelix]MBE4703870.1 hypothetical protein [Spiroplasma platyhelix PALS-1]NKE38243.1 hypothetical protein [Spiroplasma platyhelix PALS-1]UJB29128.1 hypothetical protein SPLAT_v1c03640 [Spiroplasma platyhelix PALS-1]
MENKVEVVDKNQTIEIDQTNSGKLSVSKTVLKKLIYRLLTSENYQVDFDGIQILNKENADLEAQIQVMVNEKSNLIDLKEQIIKLILKRINAVLNVNVTNINLIFSSK